jgi:hypothetical protein
MGTDYQVTLDASCLVWSDDSSLSTRRDPILRIKLRSNNIYIYPKIGGIFLIVFWSVDQSAKTLTLAINKALALTISFMVSGRDFCKISFVYSLWQNLSLFYWDINVWPQISTTELVDDKHFWNLPLMCHCGHLCFIHTSLFFFLFFFLF